MSSPYYNKLRNILEQHTHVKTEEWGGDQYVEYDDAIKEIEKLIESINIKKNKRFAKSSKYASR